MSVLLQNDKKNYAEVVFSEEDDAMWASLYKKQSNRLKNIARPEFLSNLKKFDLPTNKVPSISEISERLFEVTGWRVTPVDGLVEHSEYFSLLKRRLFPVAMFMRKKHEEDLCKDPDLFHEIFGHCTMLLSQDYADFMQIFAEFSLTVDIQDRPLFSRIIWFTTETGLIRTDNKLKIFGSSILSSYEESHYALNSKEPIRKLFDIVSIFREPYRADILQKVYYILENNFQLYCLLDDIPSLYKALRIARQLGEFTPLFPVSNDKYSNIGCCKEITPVAG